MASKKLLVVCGATGVQGGSVVNAILNDPEAASQFSIRGITRDPSSAKGKALTEKGVEMVKGDFESKESLKAAFAGAYAAFAVTNFWETGKKEVELQQGKNVADAAKEAGVQHLIWSSLFNITELTEGRLKNVAHFDTKAKIEQYIRDIGVPATFVMPGFYMSNIPGGMFREDPNTKAWKFSLPVPSNSPVPLFDSASDNGKFVKAALLNRDKLLNKRLLAATEYLNVGECVDVFKQVYPEAGKTAEYVQITGEQFKQGLAYTGMNETGQLDLLENMLLLGDVGYYGRDGPELLAESLKYLKEKPTTWAEFIAKSPVLKNLK